METKILLENGTNELEVLEFIVDGNSYGINVAKIREIITYQPVTPVPNAHPSVEGIFMPRDTMITAIDLRNCLQRGQSQPGGLFIITSFNKLDIAFHVDSVVGIHRVSWVDIIKPGATVSTTEDGISTGIIKIDGRLIQKKRYMIPLDPELTAELDIFEGSLAPLMLVEVEFPTEEAANTFTAPEWFGEDVTFSGKYHNSYLSQMK